MSNPYDIYDSPEDSGSGTKRVAINPVMMALVIIGCIAMIVGGLIVVAGGDNIGLGPIASVIAGFILVVFCGKRVKHIVQD